MKLVDDVVINSLTKVKGQGRKVTWRVWQVLLCEIPMTNPKASQYKKICLGIYYLVFHLNVNFLSSLRLFAILWQRLLSDRSWQFVMGHQQQQRS